jgi:hypothetical protein
MDLGAGPLAAAGGDDRQIRAVAGRHALEQAARRLDDHRHLDLGMRRGEAGQDRRQEQARIVVGRADRDRTVERGSVERRRGLLMRGQDAPRVWQQQLAVGRQRHAAAVALEQRPAELLLEPAHLHADRRLGPVHPLGGGGVAAGLGDRYEAAQEVGIEDRGHDVHHR